MTLERREIAEAWLRKAASDLAYAELGMCAGESYASGVAYHCQQTAEKALKALLCHFGIIPPKTHDVLRLIELLSPHVDFSGFTEAALLLSPMAADFRYPGDNDDPSREDVITAFEAAKAILHEVQVLTLK
jgi:HEPN domain-containing protein